MNKTVLLLFFSLIYLVGYSANKTRIEDSLSRLSQLSLEYLNNDPSEAINYINSGLLISKSKKDTSNLITFHNLFGRYYFQQSELDSAMFYFTNSLILSEESNNITGILSAKSNIASIYLSKGKFDEAILIFKEILTLTDQDKIKASTYNNLGLAFQYKSNYEEAISNLEKALILKKKINDTSGIANVLSNIGQTYGYMGQTQLAVDYILKGLKIYTSTDNKYDAAIACLNISTFYSIQKDYELAISFALRGINLAEEIDAIEIVKNSYFQLSKTYKEMKDFKNSLHYYQIGIAYKDSIIEQQNNEIYNQLELKFKTEQKQRKIDIQELELKQKTKTTYWLLGIIILLIIISIFIFLQKKTIIRTQQYLVKNQLETISTETELRNTKKELGKIKNSSKKTINSTKNIDTLLEELHSKLINSLENDKVYKNKGLTIFELADTLSTNKTYISKIINEKYGMNFNSFINSFRTKEAKKLLADPNNNNYTIAAISEMVGFKSISVFNKAFKEKTGVTPSVFMKMIKQKNWKS